jgi:hypothetical protein
MSKSSFLAAMLTTLLPFVISCRYDTVLPVVRTKLQPDSDGVIRDIPEDKRGEYFQLMAQRADSSLGLEHIQNGVKGLHIRVWSGESLIYKGRLFLIKHDGDSWKGEMYYFRDSFVNQQWVGAVLIKKVELNHSPRQWQELVSELFRLGIDTLPDYTQLVDYALDADGDAVLVEIAQDSFYKTYSYPTPGFRRDNIKEAQQIMQMKGLIDKKFGDKLKDPAFGG